MSERNPFIYIATGQQGVGKSYRTEIELSEYIKAHKNRPVIIFDVNNEYSKYPTLDFNVSAKRKIEGQKNKTETDKKKAVSTLVNFWQQCKSGQRPAEIRRILPYKKNKEQMSIPEKTETASMLLDFGKNCCILLEDMNTYIMRAQKTENIGALLNKRHRNQDIIIHTQALDRLDPLLFSQADVIRMHHQPSPIERIKYKLPNEELFGIAKAIVDNEYHNKKYENHKRFFVYIYPQINKLVIPVGLFPKCKSSDMQLFREGCEKYVNKNHTKCLKPYLDQIDVKGGGKKKYDIPSAFNEFVKDRETYIRKDE